MNLLSLIPGASGIEAIVIGSIIALAVGAYGLQHHQVTTLKAQLANEKTARQADRTAYADAAASASFDRLAESARRSLAQAKVANDSALFAIQAAADAAARNTAADRLRSATAALAARCGATGSDPAASAVGASASSPGDLLAYVQRRMGEAAGGVVDYADKLRPAAEQCAGSYDALTSH